MYADGCHDLLDELHVLGRTDEGQCNEIDAEPKCELQVIGVLVRHRRHANCDARQRQALVVADSAALGDVTHHVGAILDLDRDQGDIPVVHQEPIARPNIVSQVLVCRRYAVVRALRIPRS